ncbi:hypothetical protein LCGC14_2750200 [marine sediment metagenome]|uniref:Uncharacterized protein n=1 Tax=marine sediment metagenome TaxID=412755 RepID=A0A0F8ZP18_9ZZZZ
MEDKKFTCCYGCKWEIENFNRLFFTGCRKMMKLYCESGPDYKCIDRYIKDLTSYIESEED